MNRFFNGNGSQVDRPANARVWKSGDGWRYSTFAMDVDAGALGTFAPLVTLWRRKGNGAIPAWRDFDLMDFEGWWGWLSVYDAVPGEAHAFTIRLWGTRMAEQIGSDWTKRRLDVTTATEPGDARRISMRDIEYLRHVLDARVIGLYEGPLDVRLGDHYRFEEISLPLADDGAVCDKVLNAARVIEAA